MAGEHLTATATDAAGSTSELSICLQGTVTDPCPGGLCFFTATPCRLLDTRTAADGPALASSVERVLALGGACGVPASARAVSVNVTVTQPTGGGFLTFYPDPGPVPATSTINFSAGQTRANNAILLLASSADGTVRATAFVLGSGQLHLIVDVNGYFE